MIQIRVTAKFGPEVKAVAHGRLIPDERISLGDIGKIIEVEHWLERMTGLRWHIEIDHDKTPPDLPHG